MFLKKCRLCESKKLFKFLDLGIHPPSDHFKKKEEHFMLLITER